MIQVSIIIPCYNQGLFLREALDSIRRANISVEYEVLVVNDGSTESETLSILGEIDGSDFRIIHQSNKGLGAARNKAIHFAVGKYILPLDCDNKIRPGFVDKAVSVLEAEAFDILYSDAILFGEKKGVWQMGEFNLQRLMINNYIDACAMYKREVWVTNNGYDEKMPIMGYEDWDFWLKSSFNGFKFYYLREIGFEYRVRPESMLRSITEVKRKEIYDYLEGKFDQMLGWTYINSLLEQKYGRSRRVALRLILRTFCKPIYNLMCKMRVYKSVGVFKIN